MGVQWITHHFNQKFHIAIIHQPYTINPVTIIILLPEIAECETQSPFEIKISPFRFPIHSVPPIIVSEKASRDKMPVVSDYRYPKGKSINDGIPKDSYLNEPWHLQLPGSVQFIDLQFIDHMLERGRKIFNCFLDVRKAFDTVWISGLLYELFTELGIKDRMWVAIKDLYTDVKARVLYSGSLPRSFDVSQGTGQGRILAPFMYEVHINSLLHILSDHCYLICINSSKLASPSFADDVYLIALHPSLLTTFMNICQEYGLTWRYEFNHFKSGIVTFGETKAIHHVSMKEREWRLGDDILQERV